MLPAWADKYVGLPFKWNGYKRDGIGCYGLVALVLLEQFEITLPRHDDVADLLASGGEAEVPHVPGWREIALSEAQPGDVLHMKGFHGGKLVPMHIGVFVSPRNVLHIEQEAGSCVIDITARRHAWRAIGVHRHV